MERDGRVCYYLYDGHGDVRMLADENGKITDRYRYDAYGNLLEKEGDTKNDFLYTGEQYNENTGLYYLRARYMDPSTGTFISMDSYPGTLADPVSLHKYLYANADPVKYGDPSGYMSFPQLSAGMTINGILSASWRYIVGNVIAGAVIGAACGAIDSILGGNDFSQVVKDAFAGFGVGALCGCVISALACYAVIAPICMAALEVFRGIILVSSGVSVFISAKKGNVSQAIFRGILGIFAYEGTGELIDDVNIRINETSYGKSSVGAKKYSDYQWYENEVDVTQTASRSKNKISPNSNATGNHVVYKKDPVSGEITNYKVYKVNPKNLSGFDEVIGYDGIGNPHTNPVTLEDLMPHVHDKTVPGKVRAPYPDEIPGH